MVKTMNRIGAWTVILSLCFIKFALADQLVTSGDYVFLADGDLKVYDINNPSTVLKTFDVDENNLAVAVAVAISGTNAIVTVDDGSGSDLYIKVFDISEYIGCESDTSESDTSDCDSNTYLGTFDVQKGIITLPGVAVNETIYTLIMERRGKSNNWEVTFAEELTEEDDDDDDDE